MIGITTYTADARWGVWDLPGSLAPLGYVNAVSRAGGEPVLLPSIGSDAQVGADLIDGLIACGGPDIAPGRYGQAPRRETGQPDPSRHQYESTLVDLALARGAATPGHLQGHAV